MPVLGIVSRELVLARLSKGPGAGSRGKAQGGDSLGDVRTDGAILHQGLSVLMGPEALGDFFKIGQPKLESCDRSSIVASDCGNRTTPERSAL